jgi:hypothetical protein
MLRLDSLRSGGCVVGRLVRFAFAFGLLLGRDLLGLCFTRLGFAFGLLLGCGLLGLGLPGLRTLGIQCRPDLIDPFALDRRKDRPYLMTSFLQKLEDGFLCDLEVGRNIVDSGLAHRASLSVGTRIAGQESVTAH